MSDRELRRLRKAILQVQSLRAGTATRYPATVRREVLVYAGRRRAAGESVLSIAEQLGLRAQLLALWQSKSPRTIRKIPWTRHGQFGGCRFCGMSGVRLPQNGPSRGGNDPGRGILIQL